MERELLDKIATKVDGIAAGVEESAKTAQELSDRIELVENKMASMNRTADRVNKSLAFESRNADTEERSVAARWMGHMISNNHLGMTKLVREKANFFDRDTVQSITKATTDDHMYTSDNASGGYAVPTEVYAKVSRIMDQASVLLPLIDTVPQSTPTLTIPTLATKPTVYWTNEAAAKDISKPLLGVVTLTLKKPTALCIITQEMLEDNVFAGGLLNEMETWISEAFGAAFDVAMFQDNTTPYAGLLNSTLISDITMDELTMAAGLSFDYLSQMVDGVVSQVRNGCAWFGSRTVIGALRRLKDSTGAYLWAPASEKTPATIMGYPYYIMENGAPALSACTTGVSGLIFGNPKYAMSGVKKQLMFKRSDTAAVTLDSTLTSMWENNMIGILAEARRSFAVAQGGAFYRLTVG